MATETMRDYLVSLGFKVDEAGLKKFTSGIAGAAKGVGLLVAAVEGAALTVGAAVAAFASNMEALYFASQRTGASASNLKAFEKAAQNLGAGAGEALQSVESLASFMRNNPGSEGFIQSLGVQTRDANGKLRDTVDITADLGDRFAKMPVYMAHQYAGMLGISDKVMLAMRNGDFRKNLDEQKALLKDAGFEKAAKDAHEFEVKLRNLQTRIEAIGVKIGTSLIDALGPQMEQAAKWFDKNGKQIGETVAAIANFVLTAAGVITPILGTIAEGWKNIFGWVKIVGDAIYKLLPQNWAENLGKGTAWLLDKLGIRNQVDNLLGNGTQSQAATPAAKPATGGTSSSQQAMQYFVSQGWSKDQAAGIVANLNTESGLKGNVVGDSGRAYGIAQWHPDRQAEFAKFAGKDIRQSSVQEQMAFVNYELTRGAERKAGALLRASNSAAQAGQIMSRQYERPLRADAEAARRGAAAVQIAQTTTINVQGGDAKSTASAVANEQGRVNDAMTRNMATAVS